MKKIFSLFVFLFCTMAVSAAVGDTIVVNDIYYYVCTETATAQRVEVIANPNTETPYSGDIVIPVTIEHGEKVYDVYRITNYAFQGCTDITSLEFLTLQEESADGKVTEKGIVEIGWAAFQDCSNMAGELVLPSTLKRVDKYAFSGCASLTKVNIRANFTTRGAYIFADCTSLTAVEFDNKVFKGTIPERMFSGCSALTEVVIPDSVTYTGNYTFRDCINLRKVTIGESVTTVSSGCFYGCTNLQTVDFKGTAVTTIGSSAFYACANLSSITLPESLTRLDHYVFMYCTGLTGKLVLPQALTTMGREVFNGCTGITSVAIPDNVTSMNVMVFNKCTGLTSVSFGKGLKEIPNSTFVGCTSLTSVTIPDNITNIGTSAFSQCTNLHTVVFSDSGNLKTIGSHAFYTCPIAGELIIPESVDSIGQNAFRQSNITSLKIGNGVRTIVNSAFRECKNLTSLTLGNNLRTIGSEAFYRCNSLRGDVVIPDGVTTIGTYAFAYSTLRSIVLPPNLETIEIQTFAYCDSLRAVVIPDNVKYIGNSAFYSCDSLTNVEFGEGVVDIGSMVFSGCGKVTGPLYNSNLFAYMPTTYQPNGAKTNYEYEIPEGIKTIAQYAFDGCGYLFSATIPNSVTSIGDYAFRNCGRLTSAPIPETTTTLGDGIFQGCGNLNKLVIVDGVLVHMPNSYLQNNRADSIYTIPNDVHRIAGYAFRNCTHLKQVIIHDNVDEVGLNAFYGCKNLTLPIYSNYFFAFMPPTYAGAYVIPEGTKTIGPYAFNNCTELSAITIAESVDTIAPYAFFGCTGLRSVVWNAKHCKDFKEANVSPFINRRDTITSFTFGSTVEHIPAYVCYDLNNVTTITIPNSVKSIAKYAVNSIGNLQSLIVGENLDTIGYQAFGGNATLQSVVWNAKHCISVNDYYHRPFYNSAAVTSFTFGDAVEYIPSRLCQYMSLVSTITIPENVKKIDQYAFDNCTGITSVIWNAKNASYYNPNPDTHTPFPSATAITSITFGDKVERVPAYVCYNKQQLTSLVLSSNIHAIGKNAFELCVALPSITLPNNLKKIENNLLSNCNSLKTIHIPENVDTIAANAFNACNSLTSIVIPESIDSIVPSAFNGCTGLRSVTWNPRQYKDCGSSNLSPLASVRANLTSITFGDKVEHIPSYLLYNASNLTSITFTKSVQSIGYQAFNGCLGLIKTNFIGDIADWCNIPFGNSTANPVHYSKNLYFNDVEVTDVVIPESIDTIEQYAFYNCQSLRSVVINDKVKAIEKHAFWGNHNLRDLTIGESANSIALDAFAGCDSLQNIVWKPTNVADFISSSGLFSASRYRVKSFTIGDNVEHIPAYICYDMDSIASLVIPNSVKSIGTYAFHHLSTLTSLVLGKGIQTVAKAAFSSNSALKKTTHTGDIASWCGIQFAAADVNPINFSKNLYINDVLLTDLVIPDSVTSIGQYAFYNCYSLESAVIGENVASIGTSAFNGCSNIRTITWNPITYTDCESDANAPFANIRTKITSFTFGDKVEHIPAYLCYYMNNVPTYTLPKSVTSVGTSAFYYQTALKRLNYKGTIADWCKIDFANNFANPMNYARNLYINDEKIVDLIIPENVTSIGQYAFYNMAGLQTVALKHRDSSSLPTVGTDAFTTSTTNSATLHARCILAEVIASTAPWSSFKNTGLYLAYVTVQTNNPAYGTARATKQPACDGNSTAAIVATPILPAGRFYAWNDGVEDLARTITVEDDVTYTAYFYGAEDYTVHVDGDCTISSLTWGDNYTDLSICDIVVADGVTLTCDQDVTVQNMTVNGGGKLVVSDGVQLTITDTFTAQSKDDAQPQMLTEGTGAIKYGDFQFVKNIPADRYYFFSLPFASNTSSVTIDNGAGGTKAAVYNTDWNYLYYDGAAFAQKPSNDSYWMTAAQGTIQPNQGYAVGVDAATADTYRSLAFKATSTPDFSLNSDYTVAVTENPLRDDYVHPDKETFKGWNFIYNPYTSNFGGTLSLPGIADTDVYVSIPKAGQNKTYTQCRLSDLSESGWDGLPPFYGFFVQVLEDGNVTFDPNGQTISLRAPSASRTTQTAPHYVALTLSDGAQADATTLVIGEHYTDNYEIGSDLQKMLGYGTEPQVYLYNGSTKYAFKSVNETAAAQVQPLGVYLPATGEYTFSLKDAYDDSSIQAIYLYDYETDQCVNLLQTDYTFTSSKTTTEKRFALSVTVQKAPSITTAMDATDACVLDAWQEGALCIRVEGVQKGATIRLVNVQGQVVSESTAMDNSISCSVPQSGLYMVEVTSATGVQVKKIVVM